MNTMAMNRTAAEHNRAYKQPRQLPLRLDGSKAFCDLAQRKEEGHNRKPPQNRVAHVGCYSRGHIAAPGQGSSR
jgi:hypothetical protein